MKRNKPPKPTTKPRREDLQDLVEQITVDAYGDAEQLWAFHQAFEDHLRVPCGVTVAGAPVTVNWLCFRCRDARCAAGPWPAGSGLTLRAKRFWDLAPGEIVLVRPNKQCSYAANPYLSGEIEPRRIDTGALGLTPLRLEGRGIWDPAEEYWGEEGDPIEGRDK